jgi:isoquinoline 1-oxidoreductase alpha subunit
MTYKIKVNGRVREVDVDGDTPLLWVLRDSLELKGAKFGCGAGFCGACTVHLNGSAIRSCITPIQTVGEASITTIEAIGETPLGRRVQKAWLDHDVVQCGYCQAGQIMSATALLKTQPQPTDADIDAGMAGNICRCATYLRIRAAIKDSAGALQKAG